jgi:hypothetical protein
MYNFSAMKQHVFSFFINNIGHHIKGVAIDNAVKSIYNKNLGFIAQKCILNTTERFKQ